MFSIQVKRDRHKTISESHVKKGCTLSRFLFLQIYTIALLSLAHKKKEKERDRKRRRENICTCAKWQIWACMDLTCAENACIRLWVTQKV
jgi:hypothetical protein